MNYGMVSGGVGNNLGGAFPAAPMRANGESPVRESELQAELRQLQSVLDECERRLTVLGERLSPVLRGEPPATAPTGQQIGQIGAQTQVGARINQMAGFVCAINDRLMSINERLEV